MNEKEVRKILETPLDGSYAVSVEVVLFSKDFKQVCLVLEDGGRKQKRWISYFKPRAWENPGGGVRLREIPFNGGLRELEEETGFPKNKIELSKEILSFRQEGDENRTHYKIVLSGRILCENEEYPFFLNPARDTLGRIFVPIAELPNKKTAQYWKREFEGGEYGILLTHLENILANQRQAP